MPTTPRQPQDRKPKAAKAGPFTFDADVEVPATKTQPAKTVRKTFTLPPPSQGSKRVKGRILRDAAMSDDASVQMRLNLAILEASGATAEALDALYDLDAEAMSQVILDWLMSESGEGTVPQS